MKKSNVCILLFLLSTVRSAKLRVVEAGKSSGKGPELEQGFNVCPRDLFGHKGISIECECEGASFVNFFVNGRHVRREGREPFLIAGDFGGNIFKWEPPAEIVTIECIGDNDERSMMEAIRVTGTFECSTTSNEPTSVQPPTTAETNKVEMLVVEAERVNGKKSAPLQDDFLFCLRDFGSRISLECVAPGASRAAMMVNGQVVRNEGAAPFMMAGDRNGNAHPWNPPSGTVSVGCSTNAGTVSVKGRFECTTANIPSTNENNGTPATEVVEPESVPATVPRVGVSPSYCVLIPANTYTNTPSSDWVLDGIALTYKPTSSFMGTVGPNRAPLRYTFTVPIASHYFIALDSETPDVTEHNDAWIQFDAVTLRGKVNGEFSIVEDLTKPLKAYQNTAGRFTGAFSVDFEPHSFSTSQVLLPGTTYRITVSARSTQFKLYGIIMFPCAEEQCDRFESQTRSYVNLCKF